MARLRRPSALLAGAALAGYAVVRRVRGRGRVQAPELRRSITIEAPRAEVYRRWREPATQPPVWSHFAELSDVTGESARWRVGLPLGRALVWDTRIVEEREDALVRWTSTGGSLWTDGAAEFRDGPAGATELTLHVRFDPPGGPLGDAAARLLDDPPKLVLAKALRRFKSLVETGEIPSTERNPSARAA